MSSYISNTLRRLVFQRAFNLCEYCLIHESDSYLSHQIEHIIGLSHGGASEAYNLACCCFLCNRNKGTNLSTVVFPDLEVVRLYRPRTDLWLDHFEFSGASILPKTLIGQATVKVLDFNSPERTEERAILLAKGRYPHATASQYLASQLV
jgi:HNH endonuclease